MQGHQSAQTRLVLDEVERRKIAHKEINACAHIRHFTCVFSTTKKQCTKILGHSYSHEKHAKTHARKIYINTHRYTSGNTHPKKACIYMHQMMTYMSKKCTFKKMHWECIFINILGNTCMQKICLDTIGVTYICKKWTFSNMHWVTYVR